MTISAEKKVGEPRYSVAGLRNGIERAQHNKQVLKAAIQAENETIQRYEKMIRDLEYSEKMSKPVQVVAEHVDDEEGDE